MTASASFTPTAEFVTGSVLTLADGDPGDAVSLNAAPKSALNQAAYLLAATDGILVWARKARVATGGAASGNTGIYVFPIEAVSLLSGSTWVAKALASETQLTTADHFSGGTLNPDTNYYIYAVLSGGALSFEISATVPDAALTWKTAATGTARYLFTVHTDSAGVPLPMQMSGGRYHYRRSAITATELRALNASAAAGSPTDIILARAGVAGRELLPAHARVAHLLSEVTTAGNHVNDLVTVSYGCNGDLGTSAAFVHRVYGPTSVTDQACFACECDSARTIDYTLQLGNTDAGDPTTTTNLYVTGFEE